MAITSAFQADDAGSIPATRSIIILATRIIQHWRVFYVGAGCFKTSLVLRLWFEVGYSLSADFLQQWNGALSVEISYFLAGLMMHYPGVVKTLQRCSSVRGWFKESV